MEQIKRNSRIVRIFAQLGIYFAILGAIFVIFMMIETPAGTNLSIHHINIPMNSLPMWDKIAISIIIFCFLAVFLMACIYLKKLFALYEQGIIFDDKNVKYMRGFSYSIILYSIVNSFSGIVPPTHKIFEPDLVSFIIGVIFLVISMVIDEGRKIKQEQNLTV